jgi:hypothetical protein
MKVKIKLDKGLVTLKLKLSGFSEFAEIGPDKTIEIKAASLAAPNLLGGKEIDATLEVVPNK